MSKIKRSESVPATLSSIQKDYKKKSLKPTDKSIHDFKKIYKLGQGNVSKVYLVRDTSTNSFYAMKEMLSRDKKIRIFTEQLVLCQVQHPFLTSLYYSLQSESHLYFIMDYCAGGTLYAYINSLPDKCLSETAARFYISEVVSGLEYLHSLAIVYRDLKLENLLITSSGHLKISDFDLSKQFFKSEEEVIKTHSFVGTEEYLAPEIIKNKGHDQMVDWWTLGILLYELIYGTTPFKSLTANTSLLFKNILNHHPKFPHPTKPQISISNDAKQLIKKLLIKQPEKRLGRYLGSTEIKSQSFFNGVHWDALIDQQPPFVPLLKYEWDTKYFQKQDQSQVDEDEVQWEQMPDEPVSIANSTGSSTESTYVEPVSLSIKSNIKHSSSLFNLSQQSIPKKKLFSFLPKSLSLLSLDKRSQKGSASSFIESVNALPDDDDEHLSKLKQLSKTNTKEDEDSEEDPFIHFESLSTLS